MTYWGVAMEIVIHVYWDVTVGVAHTHVDVTCTFFNLLGTEISGCG